MSQLKKPALSRRNQRALNFLLFRVKVLGLAQAGLTPKEAGFALKCPTARVYRVLVSFGWTPHFISPDEWALVQRRRKSFAPNGT